MSLLSLITDEFPFSEREALELLNTAPARYKVHSIEKRNGRGQRTIAQPTAEIKLLQRWAVSHYREKLPVHSAATAYVKGRGILQHAQGHAENSYLLKLDFKDFFPSIRGIDVRRHLALHLGLPSEDLTFLTKLFCWRGRPIGGLRLSIGAPSSPFLSNTLMFDMDLAIHARCKELNALYTRYADDIAISTSTPKVLDEMHRFVSNYCRISKYPRLTLNQEKTVFSSKKNNRHLTGLTLSNDGTASLGRDKKRKIRAMLHRFSCGNLEYSDVEKLNGWIAFSLSIDPDFVASLERMAGADAMARLKQNKI